MSNCVRYHETVKKNNILVFKSLLGYEETPAVPSSAFA